MPRTTICSIIKQKDKCQGEILRADPIKSTRNSKINTINNEMEKLLNIWMYELTEKNVPKSQLLIQAKALNIFNDIKKKYLNSNDTFKASNGWFEKFKKRIGMHNIKIQGESSSSDHVAPEKYPEELKNITTENGYTDEQIFNVDETALYWKQIPQRTFVSTDVPTFKGFKQSKEKLSLLLGGNRSGDFRIKPLAIYHSKNPRALRQYNKNTLPVVW